MLDDLEEFLRRAAEQRTQQTGPKAPAPQRTANPGMQAQIPRQPVVEILDEPVEAEIIEARPLTNIGAHVNQHQFGVEFSQHAEDLAEGIEQADERLIAHLHDTFDHRVGSMDDSTTFVGAGGDNVSDPVDVPQKDSQAAEIAEMLRNPQSVRNAVVLSEILARPNW